MMDETAEVRKGLVQEINGDPQSRTALEGVHGQVWDTAELARDFDVMGFAAPLVVVVRKADAVTGSLFFQHAPRFYFTFRPNA